MHWRPVPPPPVDNQLSTDLMFKIEKYLFGDHWDYNSGYVITSKDKNVISFLHGLSACGVPDAEKLIGLIQQHGMIEIWAGSGDGPR